MKKLTLFIGDIRDQERLELATKDVDIIIHSSIETSRYC